MYIYKTCIPGCYTGTHQIWSCSIVDLTQRVNQRKTFPEIQLQQCRFIFSAQGNFDRQTWPNFNKGHISQKPLDRNIDCGSTGSGGKLVYNGISVKSTQIPLFLGSISAKFVVMADELL